MLISSQFLAICLRHPAFHRATDGCAPNLVLLRSPVRVDRTRLCLRFSSWPPRRWSKCVSCVKSGSWVCFLCDLPLRAIFSLTIFDWWKFSVWISLWRYCEPDPCRVTWTSCIANTLRHEGVLMSSKNLSETKWNYLKIVWKSCVSSSKCFQDAMKSLHWRPRSNLS